MQDAGVGGGFTACNLLLLFRYPDGFDAATNKFGDCDDVKKLIQKINVNPIINVHHSNVIIRKQATVQLVELVRNKQVGLSEYELRHSR